MIRWPPILWLCVFAGSILLLNGYDGARYNPEALIPGIVLVVAALAASLWLAFGRWGHRPQNRFMAWLVAATVVFYGLCAIGGLAAGAGYAIAAVAAGMIPFTAVTIMTAASRAKTAERGGDRRDTTAEESDDPFPSIGGDDATPFGDTPEHSDAERVARPDDRFEPPGRRRAR
jgi:hypothetical protein